MARRTPSRQRRRNMTMEWDCFIDGDGDWHVARLDRDLRAEGWERSGRVKVYLTKANTATMRFVWRKRLELATHVHTVTYTGIPVPLAKAPVAA